MFLADGICQGYMFRWLKLLTVFVQKIFKIFYLPSFKILITFHPFFFSLERITSLKFALQKGGPQLLEKARQNINNTSRGQRKKQVPPGSAFVSKARIFHNTYKPFKMNREGLIGGIFPGVVKTQFVRQVVQVVLSLQDNCFNSSKNQVTT